MQVGDVFGRWVVTALPSIGYAQCRCACGTVREVRRDSLYGGGSKSCGCLQREKASETMKRAATVHGEAADGWDWLLRRACRQKKRCEDPNDAHYKQYGARGIEFRFGSVAEATAYYKTLPGCSKDLQLDRIDNDGHYEVGNIRFVTRKKNMRNRSVCTLYTYDGVTQSMAAWSEQLGICANTLNGRLKRGWSVERTFSTPVKQQYNQAEKIKKSWKKRKQRTQQQSN